MRSSRPLVRALAALLCAAPLLAPSLASALSIAEIVAASSSTVRRGQAVSGGFDFDGDGVPDGVVGQPLDDSPGVNSGSALWGKYSALSQSIAFTLLNGAAAGDSLGWSVVMMRDFNNDGYADIAVGAPGANNAAIQSAGKVFVYYGGPTADGVADLTLSGTLAGASFGWALASGDVNGDGVSDLIVGAPGEDALGIISDAGTVYVFLGSSSPSIAPAFTMNGTSAGQRIGDALVSGGDINQDGFDDLVIGRPLADDGGADSGALAVHYGGTNLPIVALTITGAAGDQLGASLALLDMNGDGYDDLAVGSPNATTGTGRVTVYAGGSEMSATASLTIAGVVASGNFGAAVCGGDWNGDGFDDLAVGAPAAGLQTHGSVRAYFGGAAFNGTVDLSFGGQSLIYAFGAAISSFGDMDGDGHDDLGVGCPTNITTSQLVTCFPYAFRFVEPRAGGTLFGGRDATVRWQGRDPADLALSLDGGASWTTLGASIGGQDENAWTFTPPLVPSEHARLRLTIAGQSATRANSRVMAGDLRIVALPDAHAVTSRVDLEFDGAAGARNGFGLAIADVNGDGRGDLCVGVPNPPPGAVRIYFGAQHTDGVPDLTLTGVGGGNALFGATIADVGDVNGDGYGDLLVGAPEYTGTFAREGRAFLYFGGPLSDATADLTIANPTPAADDRFGASLSGVGDFNNDGGNDFVIGAPFDDASSADCGVFQFYLGGAALDATSDGFDDGAVGDRLGSALAGVGDVTGDGLPDFAIGSPFADFNGADSGELFFQSGSVALSLFNANDFVFGGSLAGEQLGSALATGDFDGDGRTDIAALAAGNLLAPRVYLWLSYDGVMESEPDVALTPALGTDRLKTLAAGDLNGDGVDDLAIGAIQDPSIGTTRGRVGVYYGGGLLDGAEDLDLSGPANGDSMGLAIAVGDLAADGFADLAIGMPGVTSGAGRVRVLDYGRYHLSAPASGVTWPVGSSQRVAWSGAESADLELSVDNGATWTTLASAVGGRDDNETSLRVPHLPTRFARLRVVPNDRLVGGFDVTDSSFTIQTSVALLSLAATAGEQGVELTWRSDPAVGPEGLAGYRVYRMDGGALGTRIGSDLIAETRFVDAAGRAGTSYRLASVNGLGEELELGRVTAGELAGPLAAWPTPLVAGDALRVRLAAPLAANGFPASDLEVGLYDLAGRRIARFAGSAVAPLGGAVNLEWRGGVAPGLYFVRAAAPSAGYREERRVVVVK